MNRLCNTVLVLSALVIFTSCSKEIEFNDHLGTGIRSKFLVDRIYDYNGNLLTEYIYDDNNRLTKRIITTKSVHPIRTDEMRSEDKFEYVNGRVSKIITDTWSYTIWHQDSRESRDKYYSETTFEYDRKGRLTKGNGVYGQDLDFRYENGRVVGFLNNKENPWFITDTMVYDNSGNIIKHISIGPELNNFGQPIPGTSQRNVRYYEYDDKPKPNFGLDYLFTFQPLPGQGGIWDYANHKRLLSKNNITEGLSEGYKWTYTYNENGLPATIETIWLGCYETEWECVPNVLRITYKQIE